jgi:hypothetical protein
MNVGARGSVVVEAVCYKPEGRGFETPKGKMIFSSDLIFPAALGPGIYSAVTEMSTRSRKIMFLGIRARLVRKADSLTAICEPCV